MRNDDLFDVAPIKAQQTSPFASSFSSSAVTPGFAFTKRMIDIVGSLVLLVFFAPLLVLLAVLVASDGHPALYGQKRLGQEGRHFIFWKFRSMVPDADLRLREHIANDPEARAEWDANQKLRHDPRVTRIGRVLRKYSLDELPQLFNVLWGDMSLVGPRPMMVEQQALYPGPAYAGLRPGLTGLWQISKRDDATFAARARFDAAYAQNLSLTADFKIALLTIGYLFAGRGC